MSEFMFVRVASSLSIASSWILIHEWWESGSKTAAGSHQTNTVADACIGNELLNFLGSKGAILGSCYVWLHPARFSGLCPVYVQPVGNPAGGTKGGWCQSLDRSLPTKRQAVHTLPWSYTYFLNTFAPVWERESWAASAQLCWESLKWWLGPSVNQSITYFKWYRL